LGLRRIIALRFGFSTTWVDVVTVIWGSSVSGRVTSPNLRSTTALCASASATSSAYATFCGAGERRFSLEGPTLRRMEADGCDVAVHSLGRGALRLPSPSPRED
jgi:hypothetical protein